MIVLPFTGDGHYPKLHTQFDVSTLPVIILNIQVNLCCCLFDLRFLYLLSNMRFDAGMPVKCLFCCAYPSYCFFFFFIFVEPADKDGGVQWDVPGPSSVSRPDPLADGPAAYAAHANWLPASRGKADLERRAHRLRLCFALNVPYCAKCT